MLTCLSPNGPMVHDAGSASSRVLVATQEGVAVLDLDATASAWQATSITLEGLHVSALLFEPSGDGVFAATHGQGIFLSRDRGETWSPASEGLALRNVFSLAASVRDGKVTLLAGTEPVMLFSSADYGRTWRPHPAIAELPGREKWTFPAPPHAAHLKSIAVHESEPDVYYACIEQGALLKTTDAGRTWTEISSYARPADRWYRDVHKLVPVASDPRRLYMSTGNGVYRSDDGGTAWQKLTETEFPIGYPDHLIVSPRNAQKLFVAGASTPPNVWRETHVAKATVMCSDDAGAHWSAAADGLPVNGRAAIEAMSVAIAPGGYELFLANTDGEVYSSKDEGASWQRIAAGLAPVSKAMHARYVT